MISASSLAKTSQNQVKQRRKKKIIELIDVGGKKVSKTSTGKRKFHNKSKNGCDNCKRRRVKCDEAKPACVKCSNMKLDCVYSIIDTPQRPPSTLTTTIIIDKTVEPNEEGAVRIKTPNNQLKLKKKKEHKARSKSRKNEPSLANEYKGKRGRVEINDNNILDNSDQGLQGPPLLTVKKEEGGNPIRDQRKGSIVVQLNSPEKLNLAGNMDALLLPSLANQNSGSNSFSLQQQLFLLPQLMSLSNSEKFTNFDLSSLGNLTIPNATNNNNIFQKGLNANNKNSSSNPISNPLNLDSPLQSAPLNHSTSISSMLSMNKFSIPQNMFGGNIGGNNNMTQPVSLNSNSNNSNNVNNNFQNTGNNSSNGNNSQVKPNQQTINIDSMALLKNAGINLKSILEGTQLSGLAQCDPQDLLNFQKAGQSMRINIAEEVLSNMQKQMIRSLNSQGISTNNNSPQTVGTPNAVNNPTITPSAQMLPINRNILESENSNLSPLVPPLQNMNNINTPSNLTNIFDRRRSINIDNNSSNGNINHNQTISQHDSFDIQSTMNGINESLSKKMIPERDGTYNDSLSVSGANNISSTHGNFKNKSNSKSSIVNLVKMSQEVSLNLVDLKLLYHYNTVVWKTIIDAGISGVELWSKEIIELAFEYPFLMHSLLAFSATHLSRREYGLENYVSSHRIEALRLLREAVLQISPENTDALVASAIILIMDSLANASGGVAYNPYRSSSGNINLDSTDSEIESPTTNNDVGSTISNNSSGNNVMSTNVMSASAWIFHVKGASTILTAVWPLDESSKFHDLISIDLSEFSNLITQEISKVQQLKSENGQATPSSTGTSSFITELICFDESISDLYPVEIDSPYLVTLAILDKLNRESNEPNFILKIFAFPALLDKTFLALLMTGDLGAMRIMRSYYKLLRGYTTQMMDKVWFLEGVSQVLPQDVDEYSGGGGMHMMLDFLGGGLPSMTTTNLSEFM
ncbi:hypothetical protein TPHA_0L01060 [Tetrapisispora phaffii CBS 4417]|uniref:Zn(2)-C6 fungal-type domain-containing protein n=1 Tax=Tetrapisispora phaffii (strain ATCC 24235 / CBS 4417 / NBRC 1672 / NRRL Y-8282 / UCD 70-5) TaxID=1071381 RepID=G8BZY5_TETPH|nr:hypothetical protein TPHA_0L01060 [Tetrapisispora phaffii CBS 4417]CCE65463.1 hypothetical protein TPHA_0L01060 [Tetrapisispora phaffii CBS 4417]